jgi:nitrogen fixation NifU-like protein
MRSPCGCTSTTTATSLKTVDAFSEMISSRGTIEGDEEVLGDGIAFAGVAKYPARVKCALLGWMAFKDAVVRIVSAQEAKNVMGNGISTKGQHDE